MTTRLVLVSIVNWNTCAELRRCLTALHAVVGPALDVVVIDNASADGSADMVQTEFPWVRLIRAGRNVGFAGGNNLALQDCKADFALILNPDVEIAPGALERLIAFLDTSPAAAAVAPALAGDDGRIQSHLYRRFPTSVQIALFWTVLRPLVRTIAPLRRRVFEHDLRGTAPVEVDQLPGAALLIRAAALREVGLLDAGYFVWWEDVDWCYRARQAGLTLHVLPDVVCRHAGGASFAVFDAGARVFQFYRAFVRFLCKHRFERLLRLALPVLTVDLVVKELILRVADAVVPTHPPRHAALRPARRAIHEIVRRHSAGQLVDFSDAAVPTLSAAPPLPPPEPGDSTGFGQIDVVIVNWNGRRWLPRCIEALQRSTVPVRIVVVDNASTDGSAEYVRVEHPDVELLAVSVNVGYAAGANLGVGHGTEPYVFVMNPDVVVAPDHLEVLRARFAAEPRLGAAQGKLFHVTAREFEAGVLPARTLDSAGHRIRRSRMVVDRGQGRPDEPAFDAETSVFSACGAALFLRRSMLNDLAPGGEYFESSFFAYKEDIDLCWRARILGWDIRYVPTAIAHHVRNLPLTANAWRSLSPAARRHSWKNHYLLMLRNDRLADLLRDVPFVLGWEAVRLGHALLRDHAVLSAGIDVLREVRPALRARRELFARRRATHAEIRRWFGGDSVITETAGTVRPRGVAV